MFYTIPNLPKFYYTIVITEITSLRIFHHDIIKSDTIGSLPNKIKSKIKSKSDYKFKRNFHNPEVGQLLVYFCDFINN